MVKILVFYFDVVASFVYNPFGYAFCYISHRVLMAYKQCETRLDSGKKHKYPHDLTCFTYGRASTAVEGAKQEDTRRGSTNEMHVYQMGAKNRLYYNSG